MATLLGMAPHDRFLGLLSESIKRAVEDAVAEAANEAAEKVRRQVNQQADKIAVSMLTQYDVKNMGDQLVITVRKMEAE